MVTPKAGGWIAGTVAAGLAIVLAVATRGEQEATLLSRLLQAQGGRDLRLEASR